MINMSVHRKNDARTRFEDVLLMRCNLNYTIWDECGLYCRCWSRAFAFVQQNYGGCCLAMKSSDCNRNMYCWHCSVLLMFQVGNIVWESASLIPRWFFPSLSLNSSHLFRNSKQYPIVFCAYAHRSQWLPHAAVSVYHPSVCVCVSAIYKVLHFVQCSLPFASHRIACSGKH